MFLQSVINQSKKMMVNQAKLLKPLQSRQSNFWRKSMTMCATSALLFNSTIPAKANFLETFAPSNIIKSAGTFVKNHPWLTTTALVSAGVAADFWFNGGKATTEILEGSSNFLDSTLGRLWNGSILPGAMASPVSAATGESIFPQAPTYDELGDMIDGIGDLLQENVADLSQSVANITQTSNASLPDVIDITNAAIPTSYLWSGAKYLGYLGIGLIPLAFWKGTGSKVTETPKDVVTPPAAQEELEGVVVEASSQATSTPHVSKKTSPDFEAHSKKLERSESFDSLPLKGENGDKKIEFKRIPSSPNVFAEFKIAEKPKTDSQIVLEEDQEITVVPSADLFVSKSLKDSLYDDLARSLLLSASSTKEEIATAISNAGILVKEVDETGNWNGITRQDKLYQQALKILKDQRLEQEKRLEQQRLEQERLEQEYLEQQEQLKIKQDEDIWSSKDIEILANQALQDGNTSTIIETYQQETNPRLKEKIQDTVLNSGVVQNIINNSGLAAQIKGAKDKASDPKAGALRRQSFVLLMLHVGLDDKIEKILKSRTYSKILKKEYAQIVLDNAKDIGIDIKSSLYQAAQKINAEVK